VTGAVAVARDWRVRGSYFEACNCEAICPCRSVGGRPGGRSTYGICQFALSWHVEHGHAGEVDLSGLDVVMAGFYLDDEPGSPWQVVLYVDDRAPEAAARWLERIFLGRAGGSAHDNFAGAITVVHRVRRARISLSHEPGTWSMGVEGHVRVAARQVVASDEPVACGIPGLDRPGSELVAEQLAVDDDPLSWEMRGRCAFTTDFDYRGQAPPT
jgi:hypothetical protein